MRAEPDFTGFTIDVLCLVPMRRRPTIYSGTPSGLHKLADEPISGQRIFYEIRHIFCVDVTCAHKWCTSPSDSSTEGKRRVNRSRTPRETAAHSSTGGMQKASLCGQLREATCGPHARKIESISDQRSSETTRSSTPPSGVIFHNFVEVVGAARFELTTFCTQNRRATRLRHAPTDGGFNAPD